MNRNHDYCESLHKLTRTACNPIIDPVTELLESQLQRFTKKQLKHVLKFSKRLVVKGLSPTRTKKLTRKIAQKLRKVKKTKKRKLKSKRANIFKVNQRPNCPYVGYGQRVVTQNLEREEFNNKLGTIKKCLEEGRGRSDSEARWLVQLDETGQQVSLQSHCLKPLAMTKCAQKIQKPPVVADNPRTRRKKRSATCAADDLQELSELKDSWDPMRDQMWRGVSLTEFEEQDVVHTFLLRNNLTLLLLKKNTDYPVSTARMLGKHEPSECEPNDIPSTL